VASSTRSGGALAVRAEGDYRLGVVQDEASLHLPSSVEGGDRPLDLESRDRVTRDLRGPDRFQTGAVKIGVQKLAADKVSLAAVDVDLIDPEAKLLDDLRDDGDSVAARAQILSQGVRTR